MDFMKGKTGILILIIGLCLITGIVWYLLFGSSGNEVMDGTLVQGFEAIKRMVCI